MSDLTKLSNEELIKGYAQNYNDDYGEEATDLYTELLLRLSIAENTVPDYVTAKLNKALWLLEAIAMGYDWQINGFPDDEDASRLVDLMRQAYDFVKQNKLAASEEEVDDE